MQTRQQAFDSLKDLSRVKKDELTVLQKCFDAGVEWHSHHAGDLLDWIRNNLENLPCDCEESNNPYCARCDLEGLLLDHDRRERREPVAGHCTLHGPGMKYLHSEIAGAALCWGCLTDKLYRADILEGVALIYPDYFEKKKPHESA